MEKKHLKTVVLHTLRGLMTRWKAMIIVLDKDNHTIDVIVGDGEKTFRLYLTAFMDARSGIITSVYLTDAPQVHRLRFIR